MTILSYPARPVNGGDLMQVSQRFGDWNGEPKYNGWRTVVHLPTGTCFNRHGALLSIADEFRAALKKLRALGLPSEWADCEALERRHHIGQGTLILLDYFGHQTTYLDRRAVMERLLAVLKVSRRPASNRLYLVPSFSDDEFAHLWYQMQAINRRWGVTFYEGVVAKRTDTVYPLQRLNASRETPHWVKHTFPVRI